MSDIHHLTHELREILQRRALFKREVSLSDRLLDDLGIDSLSTWALISEVEEVFAIQFALEDLTYENLETVGGLAELIAIQARQPG